MDEWIEQLENLTFGILEQLDEVDYGKLAHFANSRRKLLKQLDLEQGNRVNKEQFVDRITKILEADRQIVSRMNQLKDEASSELIRIRGARKQKGAYQMKFSPDSLFFDKKN